MDDAHTIHPAEQRQCNPNIFDLPLVQKEYNIQLYSTEFLVGCNEDTDRIFTTGEIGCFAFF